MRGSRAAWFLKNLRAFVATDLSVQLLSNYFEEKKKKIEIVANFRVKNVLNKKIGQVACLASIRT